MAIRALVVDDEKLARSRLKRLLSDFSEVEVMGEAANGKEAVALIHSEKPDVVFLDIRMPMMSGFDVLSNLEQSPFIIFTTAYDQYALQAFEENTIDYLLKPISTDRLGRAIDKLSRLFDQGNPQTIDVEKLIGQIRRREERFRRFSVRLGDQIIIIPAEDVVYFHAEEKYTFLHTKEKEYIVSFTLKDLEERLDSELFIRVHRSTIINLEKIETIQRWFNGRMKLIMIGGREIIVSAKYVQRFKEKIEYR